VAPSRVLPQITGNEWKDVKNSQKLITLEEALQSPRLECCERFEKHVSPEEARLLKLINIDKRYTKAEGATLYDDKGNTYLDFTAGFGSLNLGHNPPEVLEAVKAASMLPAVLLMGHNPLVGALASNLAMLLPGEMEISTFGSGGAEAVEIALRTARGSTKRKKFLSCVKGYHGLSFGAMSIGGAGKYCETCGPLLDHCESIPFGDLDALESKLKGDDIAAFVVEPVQGEGGMVVPPKGYLKAAEEACHRHGTLLVLDEIQTGFGRTGKMFAMEHESVVPDIVTLSKSLGSGVVPISAAVTTADIWKKAFGHRDRYDLVISTFGGHSRACAAALKTIEIMVRDKLWERAAELGNHAEKGLGKIRSESKHVKDVRGQGLMLGVELDPPSIPGANMDENMSGIVINALADKHGILTGFCDLAPTVLRFEPPLIVTKEQIDKGLGAYEAVLGKGTLGLTLGFMKTVIGRTIRPPRIPKGTS
jgi:putrescine aminotransferase